MLSHLQAHIKFNHSLLVAYAALLLLISVLVFGALEPEYSHAHQSVSSLGALSAQYTWVFNFFGLMLPGVLVALAFYRQYRTLANTVIDQVVSLLMVVFGLMFAGLAFPMDLAPLPYAGVTVHFILAYASVAPFLLASLLYSYRQRQYLMRLPWVWLLQLVFVVIDLLIGFGVIASGLGQRGLLLCLFLWAALVCINRAKSHLLRHD